MADIISSAAPTLSPPAASILHHTFVDFAAMSPALPVHLVQYDQTLPVLAVVLKNDGQPYVLPAGAAVNIRMDKRDGHYVYNPALGVDDARTTAYIAVTQQMTTGAGDFAPILEIVVDGGIAGTAPLSLCIDRNPVPQDAVESSDEYKTAAQLAIEAAASAAAAADSADASANSADTAAQKATAAATSATNAAGSATDAAASASSATASKNAAATSAANAAGSATAASGSADAAAASATTATQKATAAATSATNAASSASSASSSKTAAAASATNAATSASSAADSADAAAASADTATAKATAASTSASNAAASATTATQKATAAATSATNAANSATAAATSASAASSSATAAAASAKEAADSAATATTTKPSTTTPKAAGTAAVGTETAYARGDHVHPAQTTVSGNAGTATKWATARNINGMSVQGDANRVNYGTCSTAAATVAKTVACTGFALVTGAEITVKFTVTNTAASPTLNVNSTGAKAIYYRGSAISAGYLAANRTYTFRYDGTQYELVGDIDTNTTYSAMTAATSSAAGKTGLVPAPAAGKQASFLRGDGTWVVPTNTTYSAATTSAAGLMSAADKTKLDGIASMTGATASAAGKTGLVPVPAAGKQASFLRGDGTWQTPANTTYSVATQSANGLMSAADKTKLDGFGSASSYATASTASSLNSRITSVESRLNSRSIGFAADVILSSVVPNGAGTWYFSYAPVGKFISINMQREGGYWTDNVIYCIGDMEFTVALHPNNNSGATLYARASINGTAFTLHGWYCGFEYTGNLAQNLCTAMDVRAIYPVLNL